MALFRALSEQILSVDELKTEQQQLAEIYKYGMGLDQVTMALQYFNDQLPQAVVISEISTQADQENFLPELIVELSNKHCYLTFSLAVDSVHQVAVIINNIDHEIIVIDSQNFLVPIQMLK